jgi:CubicO group peptidase (beta-lactamase class C family)
MGKGSNTQMTIEGTVAPGFEAVKALYTQNMQRSSERHTQLCVYHNDEKVVDLWASVDDGEQFSPDSLVNIFSSGKSLEAIALAALVSKGLLDYSEKITTYWPEFGAQGKQDLTVAGLMRHEAGLAAFSNSIEPDDLLAVNIKQNKVGQMIESHAQSYRPDGGSAREYHAVTRGWIANELFRRVDPAGRTIGEFLREDISAPLGVDAIIGVRENELARRVAVVPLGFGAHFMHSMKPGFMRRKVFHNFFQISGRLARILPAMRKGTTRGTPPPFKGMDKIAFFNENAVAMGETPSANANCSARGLAKIAAMMAAGGKWEGVEYLSKQAWDALHADPVEADMGFSPTTFTQGGVALFTAPTADSTTLHKALNAGREGFYGWMGLGGSIFQWHPQQRIGFGYVPTSLHVLDLYNERGKAYQAAVLDCVKILDAQAGQAA